MKLWRRVRFFLHRNDLTEELRIHQQMRTDDGLGSRGFGNDLLLRERSRDAWGWLWLDSLQRDIRYALRMLRRAPGFAIVAVLSLAIGIGANAAVFSLAGAIYQRPLPVAQPQRLFTVYWSSLRWRPGSQHSTANYREGNGRRINSVFPIAIWQEWRESAGTLAQLAGFQRRSVDVGVGSGTAEHVTALMVTGNFERVLGLAPALGRGITAADNHANAPLVAEISYGLWQSRFGGERSVLGRTITVNGLPVIVVGVGQRNFSGLEPMTDPSVLLPLSAATGSLGTRLYYRKPGPEAWWVEVIGRLRAGVTLAEAHAAYSVIFARRAAAIPQRRSVGKEQPQLLVASAAHGVDLNARSLAPMLLLLRCFAGLLLLIAVVNLANLLLARTAARQPELAVRTAIGAGRGAIVRQLATEGLVLGILGGIVALPLSLAADGWLTSVLPFSLPVSLGLSGHVLGLTALVALGAGLALGLAAAWRAQRQMQAGLKQTAAAGAHHRVAKTLLAAQVALCLVVLAAAGMLLRTLHNLQSVDIGFDPQHITTFAVAPGNDGYRGVRLGAYYDGLAAQLRALPGVADVSTVTNLPGTDNSDSTSNVALTPGGVNANNPTTFLDTVSPGFFSIYRIPLRAGRDFAATDDTSAPAVAVINQTMTKRFTGNPVGQKLYEEAGSNSILTLTVVGVVANAAYAGVTQGAVPILYTPLAQTLDQTPNTEFVLRNRTRLVVLGPEIQRAAAALSPSVPITNLETQQEAMADTYTPQRVLAGASSVLAVLVLVLAAIGLYGLLTFALVRRTREIGVRMALGASGSRVAQLLIRDLLLTVGMGIGCGVALAVTFAQILASLMYRLSPRDPLTLTAAIVTLLLVAAATAAIPARRAARIDPVQALRQE